MFRTTLILLALSPLVASAADPNIGQKVFWKIGAKPKVGATIIDVQSIPFPATVLSKNGDWLWLDKAWVHKRDVMSTDEALQYFTEQIRQNPSSSAGWHGRGSVWVVKGEPDIAIKDFTEAIRLDSSDASAYYNRGTVWQSKGDLNNALKDYSEAIRLDPKDASAYINRGNALGQSGNLEESIKDYCEAIRLDPDNPAPYNYVAWIRATNFDQRFRDGKASIDYATKACELTAWKSPTSLDTLAAGNAEAGDFEMAIQWQKIAISLSPPSKHKGLNDRLNLYKSNQPFRELSNR